jgi:hypothetical protein
VDLVVVMFFSGQLILGLDFVQRWHGIQLQGVKFPINFPQHGITCSSGASEIWKELVHWHVIPPLNFSFFLLGVPVPGIQVVDGRGGTVVGSVIGIESPHIYGIVVVPLVLIDQSRATAVDRLSALVPVLILILHNLLLLLDLVVLLLIFCVFIVFLNFALALALTLAGRVVILTIVHLFVVGAAHCCCC